MTSFPTAPARDRPERRRPWVFPTVIAAIVLLAGSLAVTAVVTLTPSAIAETFGFGPGSPSDPPAAGADEDGDEDGDDRDDAARPDPDQADRSPADVEAAPPDRRRPPDREPAETPAPEPPADGEGGADTAEPEPEEPTLALSEVQEFLREYRFLIGEADGQAGQQTTAAVMAYQRVNDLAVDGVVGPATTAALLSGSAEPALVGGADDRIEVDLDAQLLHLVEDGRHTVTLQVSSGNGGTYTNANGTARARTPVGSFHIERRIHGLREAPLGTLYDPLYFYRGFAIHGSPSVPAYPASHGCVRITRADATWLIERAPDGMPVDLYGGTHVFSL